MMEGNVPQERVDFRCGLCQQKGTFHCEHDTPYRDQYLGIYDENKPAPNLVHAQRLKKETKTRENNGINQKQQVKSNAGGQNQKGKKNDTDTQENPENANSKSCTIL